VLSSTILLAERKEKRVVDIIFDFDFD
jgi:hypothetical protein